MVVKPRCASSVGGGELVVWSSSEFEFADACWAIRPRCVPAAVRVRFLARRAGRRSVSPGTAHCLSAAGEPVPVGTPGADRWVRCRNEAERGPNEAAERAGVGIVSRGVQ